MTTNEISARRASYDERPREIEPVFDGGRLVGFYLRENIAEAAEPAAGTEAEEAAGTATETRLAWEADELYVGGLSIAGYAAQVAAIIRAKYSTDAELALQRQRDAKPEEFEAYYAFCEAVKKATRDAEIN